MNIVGIDLSRSNTGIVSVNTNSMGVSSVCLKQPKKVHSSRVLEYFYEAFHKLLKEGDLVIVENYAFGKRFGSEKAGELGGILRLVCAQKKIPFVLVAVTTLKKFVTGVGKGKKELMQLKVFQKWGQEFKTNDEADAFGLAMVGVRFLGLKESSDTTILKYEEATITLLRKNLAIEFLPQVNKMIEELQNIKI